MRTLSFVSVALFVGASVGASARRHVREADAEARGGAVLLSRVLIADGCG